MQAILSQVGTFTGAQARRFLLAGNATVTIESRRTSVRYTYRVRRVPTTLPVPDVPQQRSWFVSVLIGPDNTRNYVYVGVIGNDLRFRLTKASRLTNDALSVTAFRW